MKKLKLSQSNFAGAEVLSRAQLKKVMGGFFNDQDGSGTSGDTSKIKACEGKKDCDDCIWTYEGTATPGSCKSFMAQPLACSSFRCVHK